MTRPALEHLEEALAALAANGRLRERPAAAGSGAGILNLCSNDYLGYLASGRLSGALSAAAAMGVAGGAGASRLVSGDGAHHRELELMIAEWLGVEQALLFTSGYAANIGLLGALGQAGDHIVSDALNHASIIDGCRLSKAHVTVVPHLDLTATRQALRSHSGGRQWVVTESYFSMDADGPDLPGLRAVCDEFGAGLLLDEAHALGVDGPEGAGRAAAAGVRVEALVATLGKAAAGQGAFVAGSGPLCAWLWNRARSFVYSTGLSPVLCAIGAEAVRAMRTDDAGRTAVRRNSEVLREALRAAGHKPAGSGHIVPVLLGSEARALAWGRELAERGVLVQPIRPPTVAPGSARLRVTARAGLTAGQLERAGRAFRDVAGLEAL